MAKKLFFSQNVDLPCAIALYSFIELNGPTDQTEVIFKKEKLLNPH